MARAEILELKLELLNAVWGAAHKSASLVRGPVATGAPRLVLCLVVAVVVLSSN